MKARAASRAFTFSGLGKPGHRGSLVGRAAHVEKAPESDHTRRQCEQTRPRARVRARRARVVRCLPWHGGAGVCTLAGVASLGALSCKRARGGQGWGWRPVRLPYSPFRNRPRIPRGVNKKTIRAPGSISQADMRAAEKYALKYGMPLPSPTNTNREASLMLVLANMRMAKSAAPSVAGDPLVDTKKYRAQKNPAADSLGAEN